MTNTALRRNDRAFAGLAVDLAKNPKELPTRDLRARTASSTTTTPSMSSKATATNAVEIGRWQSRTFTMCHRHSSREISGSDSGSCHPRLWRGQPSGWFPDREAAQLLWSVRGPNANPRRF